MDSGGGCARFINETFNIILTPDLYGAPWESAFWNRLGSAITLNPNRKWEAALVESFIPKLVHHGERYDGKRWFRYGFVQTSEEDFNIPSVNFKTFSERHLYHPKEAETVFHSFLREFERVQEDPALLGDFTYNKFPRRITMYINEDRHLKIQVLNNLYKGEKINIQLNDYSEYLDEKGVYSMTWGGEQIHPSEGYSVPCKYDSATKTLQIGYDHNEQLPEEVIDVDLRGSNFLSETTLLVGGNGDGDGNDGKASDMVDVMCNFLGSNKLGGAGEGMPTLAVVQRGRYEAKKLVYNSVESLTINPVRVDLLDSVTKLPVTFSPDIVGKPYIIVKFRPI